MAIAGASLVLAGYAAPSFADPVQMGFGVQRGVSDDPNWQDGNWLGMNISPDGTAGNQKWNTVNGYLNHEQATWVNAHVAWKGIDKGPSGSADQSILDWATRANAKGKKFLLSIDYHAPTDLQRSDCDLPNAGSTLSGTKAITRMKQAVHDLADLLGPALWANVRLEIGTEPNQNGACAPPPPSTNTGDGIHPEDAQLWWDIVNDVARQAANQTPSWSPGRGIVAGGVFTNNAGDTPFGGGSIGAKTWLRSGIDNDRVHDWEHWDGTNFNRYGVHTAHCTDLAERTKWTGCQQDVNDRIGQVSDVLTNNENAFTPIDVTALIPTQAGPNAPALQAQQASDSRDIWDGIRSTYAGSGQHPVKLVIWNHLVDTGQESFKHAGFMYCTNDDACDLAPNYQGKDVYDAAAAWPGVDTSP